MEWTSERQALLRLSCTDGVGAIVSQALIEHFGSASSVISASASELAEVPGVGRKLISSIRNSTAEVAAKVEMEILDQYKGDITPVFWGETGYPEMLAACFDAPLVLYLRGTLPVSAPTISVVGTRRMTPYAEDTLREVFREWATSCPDLVIVSGLAYGVDYCAHRLALDAGLRTVAVVAHGHHTLYPSTHRHLAAEMCANDGGIVTEYTYATKPLPQRFVARNRIVAGLSPATLVVESPEKGGALITANIAFDYSRCVYAVPGRLFDTHSQGCNKLIALQKASIFTSPRQMLEELGILSGHKDMGRLPLDYGEEPTDDPDDTPIVKLLKSVDDMTVEDISIRLGEPLSTVSALLFELEMDGEVRTLPGGRYAWIRKR